MSLATRIKPVIFYDTKRVISCFFLSKGGLYLCTVSANRRKKELLEINTLKKIKSNLEQNIPARKIELDEEELDVIKSFNLITLKPIIYVSNVSEEDILNTYSSLITKGLIEVKVIKENGKVSESISLDILYDKLIMNSKEEKEINTDIYSKFESEFGRSLSPIEYETINRWLNLGIDEGMILNALREAVINGVSNLRYIDKILNEWGKKGIKTQEDLDSSRHISKPKQEIPDDDYDWLTDEE